MNDREMLEWAAKAAGLRIDGWEDFGNQPFRALITDSGFWNPLTDDGDALRLAVKLDIEFYQADDDGRAAYAGYWGKPERRDVTRMFCIEPLENDPCAATRRAIVRAAAEIGKAMEG